MKKFTAWLMALTLLLSFSVGASAEDLLDKILSAGELVVGTEGTYSPNSYHDETGALVGFDVEVAALVAEKLSVKVRYWENEWDSLFAAMDTGRIDTVINEVEYNPERALKYDFSDPYTYVHGALLVSDKNDTITSFEDMQGKRSAQNLTSSWGQMAESYGAVLVSIDTLSQCVDLLRTGRADCTLNAETAFYDYMKNQPDAPVKIVAVTESTTSSVIPVPKGNERLVEAINNALLELRDEGKLSELSIKYFGADITTPDDAQ